MRVAEEQEQPEVILSYCRKEELSYGSISVRARWMERFEGWEFKEMLRHLAGAIQSTPNCRVTIQRTDQPDMLEYPLEQDTIMLFRTDSEAAIRSMVYPESPSTVIRETKRLREPIRMPELKVGHDTIADAFGSWVYARARDGKIECPGCGFWSPCQRGTFTCQKRCPKGRVVLQHVELSPRYARILTKELLGLALERYYLPRFWNNYYAWISHADLRKMYDEYVEEREQACSAAKEVQ